MQTDQEHGAEASIGMRQQPRFWSVMLYAILLGPVLGVVTAAVTTYLMPKLFDSTAMLCLLPVAGGAAITEEQVAAEESVLLSDATFRQVAERFRDEQEPALSVEKLREIVTIRRKSGSDFVEVTCVYPSGVTARDICHAFLQVRIEQFSQNVMKPVVADAGSQSKLMQLQHLLDALKLSTDFYDRMVLHRAAPCAYHAKIDEYRRIQFESRKEKSMGEAGTLVYDDTGLSLQAELKKLMQEQERVWQQELDTLVSQAGGKIPAFTSQPRVDYQLLSHKALVASKPISPSVDRNLTMGMIAGAVLVPLFAAGSFRLKQRAVSVNPLATDV